VGQAASWGHSGGLPLAHDIDRILFGSFWKRAVYGYVHQKI